MKNEDYFEYIKKKPFAERLRAFGDAIESMARNDHKAAEIGVGNENRKWYASEANAQLERANWLYKNLVEEFGDNRNGNI